MIGKIIKEMIAYYAHDPKRINHFLKVYGFGKAIGCALGLNPTEQFTLEIAAVTHDIGIKNSERKYGSSSGVYQQIEGPGEAKVLLTKLGVDSLVIERVCWLISKHHTYTEIDGLDYQILIEADFIVNALEENLSKDSIHIFVSRYFKTKVGIEIVSNYLC
ncbi:HD family phosphohydrolase [Clostridia bacterium]|nr:HD family phosphohydrolase [Clostridia bacterium]